MHLGLIGGIGPAATEYYYRALVQRHNELAKPMALTISHADTNVMIANLMAGAMERQAEIFAEHTQSLKAAGCDVVAITSMGGHFCVAEFEKISPLPVINIIPILNAHFEDIGIKTLGLLGTSAVMESSVYGGLKTTKCVIPSGDALQQTHDAYIAVAKTGAATDEQRNFFFKTGKSLCDQSGADAVLLAGTDLFVAFEGHNAGFPVLDAALIHADYLVQVSTGKIATNVL